MGESHLSGKPSLASPLIQRDAFVRLLARSPVKVLSQLLPDADLHLVGGAPRDALNGEGSADLDFAVRYTPAECEKILTQAGLRVIETGIKHGTITVVIDSENVEITTFRHPTGTNSSEFADSIEEDLTGRDFTINALAYSLTQNRLIDPFQGQDDIQLNVLRAVGSPEERFREDPLRILRLIRFGPAAGRKVEELTHSAAFSLKSLLASVSPELIRAELCKIVCSAHVIEAFQSMKELKLFEVFFPEILPSIGFEQNEFHIHDVFEHTLWVVDRTPADNLILRLSALFHDLGKPATFSIGDDGRRHFYQHEQVSFDICKQVMKRLKFSNKEIEDVSSIVRYHMRPIDCGPPGVRRLLRDLGENFEPWRRFKWADSPPVLGEEDFDTRAARFDALVENEKKRQEEAESSRLAIDGEDIKKFGIPEGRKIGEVLKFLNELVLDDPSLNDRATLSEKAREYLRK